MDQEPELRAREISGQVRWIENQATPSSSAYQAMQSLPLEAPVLLTTSDHALLSSRVIDHFCSEAQSSGCDVVAALARHEDVSTAYPKTRRTAYRVGKTAYCSCNLLPF